MSEKKEIPESDKKLVEDLQAVLDQLDSLRRKLYTRRSGCACDEKTLCALHAAVENHIWDAAMKVSLAIGQALAEG